MSERYDAADALAGQKTEKPVGEPEDFLSQIVSPEQLARVREPEKPVPRARRPGELVLDYADTRPEITDTYLSDGPLPTRGAKLDRPPTPEGSLPPLDYSETRPELAGPGLVETQRRRNGRDLETLKRDYLAAFAAWQAGRIASRPVWAANGAVDLAAQIRAHGPSIAECPQTDETTPRA